MQTFKIIGISRYLEEMYGINHYELIDVRDGSRLDAERLAYIGDSLKKGEFEKFVISPAEDGYRRCLYISSTDIVVQWESVMMNAGDKLDLCPVCKTSFKRICDEYCEDCWGDILYAEEMMEIEGYK